MKRIFIILVSVALLLSSCDVLMQVSLEKDLIGGISTQESWDKLTTNWNKIANSPAGLFADLQTVNTDISAYATEKALEGLFLQVGLEE